jgi:recombination protein RecA
MSPANAIRLQIESALAHRIPSALTPPQKMVSPVAATGIETLDDLLQGGLPVGAISELMGPECSGRTSVALSFLSRITQVGKVCAWIDVSNALHGRHSPTRSCGCSDFGWNRCGEPWNCAGRVPAW